MYTLETFSFGVHFQNYPLCHRKNIALNTPIRILQSQLNVKLQITNVCFQGHYHSWRFFRAFRTFVRVWYKHNDITSEDFLLFQFSSPLIPSSH